MSSGSFAAARDRVLAQQEARRREAQTLQQSRDVLIRESPLARLPFPFNRTAGPLTSVWNVLIDSEGTRPAVRVGQVDAELLDEELLSMLKRQVGEALKYFGTHVQDDWSQEISLGLRAVLFKLSIWDNNASYGAALQGLRYTDARYKGIGIPTPTKLQKSLYGFITVFGRYGWDKWEDWLIDQEGSYEGPSPIVQRLSRLTSRLSTGHSIAALISFMIFLVNGKHRTLVDRILRLRLVFPISQINREVSLEYLNRQLVWHAFTEFLLFLLPLIGINRWRRWLGRAWRRTKQALQTDSEQSMDELEKKGPLAFLPERTCAICYQDQNPIAATEAEILGANAGAGGGVIGSATTDLVNPYETIQCRCIYCFVCIATKIEGEEGSGWTCLRCGEIVYKCRPWTGDVIVEKTTQSKKSVGFVVEESHKQDEKTSEPMPEKSENLSSDLGSSQWQLEGEQQSQNVR